MKQTKKGFTLVELLVVIAILAILATVSVVGYTSFIARANLSNDQATISMINRNLQAEFVTGNPESAGEALTALGGLGFTDEKLVPYSAGFHYAYHLESNTFYLVDNNDTVVYPENATPNKSELWGLYHKFTSYIAGVNKYVALNTVTDYQKFVQTFPQGEYHLDLNNNFIAFAQPNGYTIHLINGYVAIMEEGAGSDYAGGETVVSMATIQSAAELTDAINSAEVVNGEKVIKDKLIVLGSSLSDISVSSVENIRFQNCVFNGGQVNNTRFVGKNLTIDQCAFFGSQGSAIHIEHLDGKLIVTNSKFINCAKGIHISECDAGSLIQGNTFNITTTDNPYGYAIRLGVTSATDKIETPAQGAAITIKDNNIEYCYAPIVLYTSVCDGYDGTISGANDYEYMHLIECSNNTFGTIHSGSKVVFNQSTTAANAEEVLAYFESIIK